MKRLDPSIIQRVRDDRAPLHQLILCCHSDQLAAVITEAAQLVPPRQLGRLIAKREACGLDREQQILKKVVALEDRCVQLDTSCRQRYAKGLRDGYEQCLYDLPRPVRFYVMIVGYLSKVEASFDSLVDRLWLRL